MKNKTLILKIILLAILALVVGLTLYQRPQVNNSDEPINFSKIDPKENENRWSTLNNFISFYTEHPDKLSREHQFYLIDGDPSTKVIVLTYKADSIGKKGGIILLKPLANGKFSIYWEITSPCFEIPPRPVLN